MCKRYCVLWIPTLFHKPLEPILKEDLLYPIKQSESQENEGISENIYHIKRTFQYIDDEVLSEKLINPNAAIRINNVLASDNETTKIYLDFILLEATEEAKKENAKYPQRNILIKAFSNNACIDELKLECKDVCKNGLILYEYKYKQSLTNYILNSDNNITNIVYHTIKSFYHEHQFHKGHDDAMLQPFSYHEEIKLRTNDNKALLHYLSQFEQIFLDKYDFLSFFRKKYDIRYYTLKEKQSHSFGDKKYTTLSDDQKKEKALIIDDFFGLLEKGYQPLLESCYETLNIFSYYQALFYSKYNRSFKHNFSAYYATKEYEVKEKLKSGEIKESIIELKPTCIKENTNLFSDSITEAYKKAINIQKAIDYIRLQKREISCLMNNEYNQSLYTASLSIADTANSIKLLTNEAEKTNRKFNCFAAIATILSIVFAGCFAGLDHSYFKRSASAVQASSIDSIQKVMHKNMSSQCDSIHQLSQEIDDLKQLIKGLSKEPE